MKANSVKPEAETSAHSSIEIEKPVEVTKPKDRDGSKKAQYDKKPTAATTKRGLGNNISEMLGQKFITDMLKPAESSGISPEKKVRTLRASPFNKKYGSVLSNVNLDKDETESEETGQGSAASNSPGIDVVCEIAPARARPQRVNRWQARYVVSDSEDEDNDSDANVTDNSRLEEDKD